MKTTEFLLSLHEQQMTLTNLSNELFQETRELMVSEHNSIIKEDNNFGGKVKNAIGLLLKRIGEIIASIKNWLANQFRRFYKFVDALIHNMKAKFGNKRIATIKTVECDIDLEAVFTLDISTHGSHVSLLKEYEKLGNIKSKEEFNQSKSKIEDYIKELKAFYEESKKKTEVKKTYNGGYVEKILNLMVGAKDSIRNIEEVTIDMKDSIEAVRKNISNLDEEDHMYLLGTFTIHVYTELNNLNTRMLAQLAVAINKAKDVIVELAK
jgi:hypothetical protein